MGKSIIQDLIKKKLGTLAIISIIIIIFFAIHGDRKKNNLQRVSVDIGNKIIQKTERKKSKISSGEKECKRVLENFFSREFTKIRPDWLKYKKGWNLEIDLFNKDLNLCVEYQGAQHTKYIPFFHKTFQDFIDQKDRDIFKKNEIEKKGFIFIQVSHLIKIKDLEKWLYLELKSKGF